MRTSLRGREVVLQEGRGREVVEDDQMLRHNVGGCWGLWAGGSREMYRV
jgi:hypothetical protein